MEAHSDELAALESLDTGKVYGNAKNFDITGSIKVVRYYAGWADKIHGETVEASPCLSAATVDAGGLTSHSFRLETQSYVT
jgi:aldehyde dehydrogenase (NAD+)